MKTPATTTRRIWFQAVPPEEPGEAGSQPIWKKLAWFVGLCLAGSLSVATVAYILRALPFGG